MPRSPTENTARQASVSSPVTGATSSPRPESVSAFQRGEPGVPTSASDSTSRASSSSRSVTDGPSQLIATVLRRSVGEPAGTGNVRSIRAGAVQGAGPG